MKRSLKKRLLDIIPAVFAAALIILMPAASHAEVVDRIVAIINDSIITLSELNAATSFALDKLPDSDRKDAKKLGEVREKVLDSLIEQKLVKQASDRAGIDISEREIDNAVDDIKKQNSMSQESLLLALAQSGLTYREYREQLKEQIRQVKFINKEFRSKISILDEEIEEYYRQNIKDFYTPASYRISMIFLPGADKSVQAEKLSAVQEGLARGDDFAGLARQYSEGSAASAGGDMGYLKTGELDRPLEEAALSLKPGDVSAPITAPDGTYIIKLTDRKAGSPMPLEEVRGEIHERLFKKVMDDRFGFWLKEVKKFAHIEIRL